MWDTILLDAWSSATIEGARTTVQQVREHFNSPKTKDDRMVINTIAGSNYAYRYPITEENIRYLWEKVVDKESAPVQCHQPFSQRILRRSFGFGNTING